MDAQEKVDKRSLPETVAKRQATIRARFGVDSAMQARDVIDKANATKVEKFGSAKVPGSGRRRMTLEEFVTRAREVHGDKYDYSRVVMAGNAVKVEIICPIHGVFLQAPAKHLAGRGCTNKECIAAKKIATTMARFGVENAMKSRDVVKKLEASNMEKFGVRNPMQSDSVKAKAVATNMSRYHVPYTCMAESVKAKREATMTSVYGGNSPMCSPSVRRKAEATMMREYDVAHALQSEAFRSKQAETLMANLGVKNPMFSPECRRKVVETKRENHTANSSGPEDILYGLLCERFGEGDVETQYWSDAYPHGCDFYVKSRDMYIELNGDWSHGDHWYDSSSDSDMAVLEKWKIANNNPDLIRVNGKTRYEGAYDTWTRADVKKRQDAADGMLNYVVFWDVKLRDAAVWFAMGCPDGHDWEREYSWLPVRDIHGMDLDRLPSLSTKHVDLSLIAKAYQFHVFYEREEAAWRENSMVRSHLPIQVYLYHNRLKYKNVVPDRISDLQLMRSFKISGAMPGYTVFDVRLMDEAIRRYDIKSVYDPCAGWGERALYCKAAGIEYLGVDINDKLFDGYESMRARYGMRDQTFTHGDSASVHLSGEYDAVLTCPPYGNTEIYGPNGAENLSGADFLVWWRNVVDNSLHVNPKYFCFQVNRKWRDEMLAIVQACGFVLTDELFYDNARSSHFNRRRGGIITKHEFESMLVLRRI